MANTEQALNKIKAALNHIEKVESDLGWTEDSQAAKAALNEAIAALAAPQASQPIGQPVSGAELTDQHEAAKLQTFLQDRFPTFKQPFPAGLYSWAHAALLSASGQSSQSEKASVTAQSSQIVARMPDGSTAANVYEAFERGRQSAVKDAEKVCDKYKRGVMDLVNVRELQRAILDLAATPAQQTEAPVNVPSDYSDRYRVERNGISYEVKCGTGTRTLYSTKFGKRDAELVAMELLTAFNDGMYVCEMLAAPAPVEQTEAQQSEKEPNE